LEGKTYVIDFDLRSYFDTVRHHIVLEKVARRIDDDAVLWLLKLILDASGKQGVPQGGVISPLLSNLYLNEVDRMLGRLREIFRAARSQPVAAVWPTPLVVVSLLPAEASVGEGANQSRSPRKTDCHRAVR